MLVAAFCIVRRHRNDGFLREKCLKKYENTGKTFSEWALCGLAEVLSCDVVGMLMPMLVFCQQFGMRSSLLRLIVAGWCFATVYLHIRNILALLTVPDSRLELVIVGVFVYSSMT